MALQHFYSRVPARVSMYNKSDGFDTFAHSEGLSREFIERELAVVYENKLSKTDMAVIRHGGLLPVYLQTGTRSGVLVQSCISYMPLDYTGERSAYLAHSLIFPEEECRKVLASRTHDIFNTEMFVKDITPFAITSENSIPNNRYPALEYQTREIENLYGIAEKYDKDIVISFIYAVLLSLCGKGKNVYFKLHVPEEQLSEEALRFINEFMSILPYPLRTALSFVTYVTDPTRYTTFKLKVLSERCPDILPSKGVMFDFQTGLIVGLHHDEVVANKQLLEFFYSLLQNSALRIEFLRYLDHVFEKMPNLQNFNLKTLTDLVFLFMQCSGLYTEASIIPHDTAVYDFLCVYEKYRMALTDEHRIRALACLSRYADHHLLIPKNVFSKVAKLYPLEFPAVKRNVMNTVLELIHTDVMREKLFAFIRSNYAQESAEMKKIITEDLSRVFYGGFLQNQLLEFFSANFAQEEVSTQDQVLEKLLLSIRTPTVQASILRFISTHYDVFTQEQKTSFYRTFFEMLPECDDLAKELVKLVNTFAEMETSEWKVSMTERLTAALEADYKKKEHRLMPLLIGQEGFCKDQTLLLIFCAWNHRKIYTEYIEQLKKSDILEKTHELARAVTIIPNITEETLSKLSLDLEGVYHDDICKANLYTWLSVDSIIGKWEGKFANLSRHLRKNITLSAVCLHIADAFKRELGENGVQELLEYANVWSAFKEEKEYQVIVAYKNMVAAAKAEKVAVFAENLLVLSNCEQTLRTLMTEYISSYEMDRNELNPDQMILLDIGVEYLKERALLLEVLFSRYQNIYMQEYNLRHGTKANPTKGRQESAGNALKTVWCACAKLCDVNIAWKDMLCQEQLNVKICIDRFVTTYGKSGRIWISNHLVPVLQGPFAEFIKTVLGDGKRRTSIWAKLFGKK